jgi:tetratricopeptide (TPR) repeat protein
MSKDLPHRPDNESEARQAIERNPHSAQTYYHLGLLLAQAPARASETEAAYRRAIELAPDNARYVYRLALWLHENAQRLAEAESAYRRAIALAPTDPFVYGGLVSLLMQQARHSDALTIGAEMRTLLTASENWYGLAALDAILGNVDVAIDHLRKAASGANFNRKWARNDPDLAALRDDPRFDEIVGSV